MSFWSALFNGGDAEEEDEDDHSWWEKGLSFGGEVVDRATGIGTGIAGTLGGVTAVVAGEGAQAANDVALALDWKTEAEHAETERLLEGVTEGAKLYTGMSAVNTVSALDPTTVDLDQRLDDSDGYWDLFFQDTSEDVGDTITAFAYGADRSLDGEAMDPEELERLRENVAKIEDEVLLGMFMFIPVAMLPQLRVLLAAASPGMLNLVIQAAVSGTNLALDIINFFMDALGLDRVSQEDYDGDDEAEEESEEESEGEEEVEVEDEPEPTVVDETPMAEEEPEGSVFEETFPEHNRYMDVETIY